MTKLPDICSFWHGELSYLAKICLASFLEKGHRVKLFSYEKIHGLPAGIENCDASTVLPRESMFFYKGNRTPAVFADLFRLKLMELEQGIWVDTDVYCVKPYTALPEYVFGYENHPYWRNGFKAQVNQAVFACPPGELLNKLLNVFASGEIPPGLPVWRNLEIRLRRSLGEELPVHHMQFGATGPMPLNHYIHALGLQSFIQSKDVFYPLDYGDTGHLLESGSALESHITARTLSVHIWNSALTGRKNGTLRAPEPDSFFDREIKRLKI